MQDARISKLAQSQDEAILLAKVLDKISAGIKRNIPAFSFFLSPRERELVRLLLGTEALFFGGIANAERTVCCYLPEYLSVDALWDEDLSPVCALRAMFYKEDKLTHRDFLGSLMGAGIRRETVGDILVGEGTCDILVTKELAPYLLQEWQSAGRTKLHLSQIPLSEVSVPEERVKEVRGTVSSLRLDCVISAGFQIARGKAAEMILSGMAALNDLTTDKPDRQVAVGDKLSLRGFGKLRLSEVGGRTRKDRLAVVICRYE